MKKAIMYGGGNIGRGFIGMLLSQSDYEVTFIDVADTVVTTLQRERSYPVRIVSTQGHEDILVEHVTAQNGNDQEAFANAMAEADIMATAVGARILPFIMGNLVAGLRRRWETNDRPLNIIICENLMDANKVVEGMIKELLTEEEQRHFDQTVGLVEASIGRMVPIQTEKMQDGNPMRVCVERYGYLPVDKDAFKGEIPEIRNMIPVSPFDFYIKRKLYVHNMGHGTCAYLGGYQKLQYIYESIDVAEIRVLVQNAMLESALALSGKYGMPLADIQLHIQDLIARFTNTALMDTCARVGGDPARKLSPEDRMIGSAKLALTQGVTPCYIAVGAAAAVLRYIDEAETLSQSVESAKKVLAEVSGLDEHDMLTQMIMRMYEMFLAGKPLAEIRRAADAAKAESLQNII